MATKLNDRITILHYSTFQPAIPYPPYIENPHICAAMYVAWSTKPGAKGESSLEHWKLLQPNMWLAT